MNAKQILIALLAIVLIGLAVTFYLKKVRLPAANTTSIVRTTDATSTDDKKALPNVAAVSKYMRNGLLMLSPVKPSEGKIFRVTGMNLSSASGTVDFTDENKSYTADFTYTIDSAGKVLVPSFTIRK